MENELIKTFIPQGAWALLFVWLLFDTRKDGRAREEKYQEREDKYQETVNKLVDKLSIVEDMKEDIEEIKQKIS